MTKCFAESSLEKRVFNFVGFRLDNITIFCQAFQRTERGAGGQFALGEWVLALSQQHKGVTVHFVEIHPKTFEVEVVHLDELLDGLLHDVFLNLLILDGIPSLEGQLLGVIGVTMRHLQDFAADALALGGDFAETLVQELEKLAFGNAFQLHDEAEMIEWRLLVVENFLHHRFLAAQKDAVYLVLKL